MTVKSVLGKFIQQKFGREKYTIYTEKLNQKESMEIFCDIYEKLRMQTTEELNQSLKELLGTVQTSIRISKHFLYISLGYVVALLALLSLELNWYIFFLSVSLISSSYLYKFMEFVKNRYCDTDVRIVLIHKIALFHLLEENIE